MPFPIKDANFILYWYVATFAKKNAGRTHANGWGICLKDWNVCWNGFDFGGFIHNGTSVAAKNWIVKAMKARTAVQLK